MDEKDFLLKSVHDEFAKRVEEENDRQNHRLSSLENMITQISNIMSSVERLATNMEHMAKEQQDQGERLKILEGRDGEKWRSIASHVVLAIISLIIGFVASHLGL
jgi:hypothetical protein